MGAFHVNIVHYIHEPLISYPATGYVITCHVEPPINKSLLITSLTVKSTPLDSNNKISIFKGKESPATRWTISIPFEAAGSLYKPMLWKYGKGKFKSSLYEIIQPNSILFFKVKDKKRRIPHDGRLIIESVLPMGGFDCDYIINLKGHQFDMTVSAKLPYQHPFITVKNYAGAILYHSNPIDGTMDPSFDPFVLSVVALGGMDTEMILEVWSDMPGQPWLIGFARPTLRVLLNNFRNDMPEVYLADPISFVEGHFIKSGYLTIQDVRPISQGPLLPPFVLQEFQILNIN